MKHVKTTKIEIVNILFSIFNAENDASFELTLAAMQAVMKKTMCDFKGNYELEQQLQGERAESYAFWFSRLYTGETYPGISYFEYLINNEGCDIDAFAEACEICIDFSFVPVQHAVKSSSFELVLS